MNLINAHYSPFGQAHVAPKPWPEFTAEFLSLYAPGLRAAATRRGMEYCVRCLTALGVTSTEDLTCELVGRLVASRPETNSPNSTRGLLRYLAALCGYAHRTGALSVSPFAIRNVGSWVRPRKPIRRKHCTRDEVARVLEHMRVLAAADSWRGWRDRRTYALTATLAYTGARAGEIIWLQVGDLDFDRRLIAIISRQEHRLKTEGSEQVIGMPEALKKILLEAWMPYRLARPPAFKFNAECKWLFPTARGESAWWSGGPGGRPCSRIRAVAAEVGVVMTPLSLRHSAATHLLHWGASKAEIQRATAPQQPGYPVILPGLRRGQRPLPGRQDPILMIGRKAVELRRHWVRWLLARDLSPSEIAIVLDLPPAAIEKDTRSRACLRPRAKAWPFTEPDEATARQRRIIGDTANKVRRLYRLDYKSPRPARSGPRVGAPAHSRNGTDWPAQRSVTCFSGARTGRPPALPRRPTSHRMRRNQAKRRKNSSCCPPE